LFLQPHFSAARASAKKVQLQKRKAQLQERNQPVQIGDAKFLSQNPA
jgi:hypothetical protein